METLEMRNTVSKMKNSMYDFKIKMNTAEKKKQ